MLYENLFFYLIGLIGFPWDFRRNQGDLLQRSFDTVSLKVEVEFSPPFQSRLSLTHLTLWIEEDRSTVKGLFERLVEEHGEKIRPLLFGQKEDEILSGLMVMINNRTFTGSALNQQDIRLGDGDKVSLLYFISGG